MDRCQKSAIILQANPIDTIGWSNAFSMQFKHGPSKTQEISNYTLMSYCKSYTKIMKFVLITREDMVSSSMKLLL